MISSVCRNCGRTILWDTLGLWRHLYVHGETPPECYAPYPEECTVHAGGVRMAGAPGRCDRYDYVALCEWREAA